MSYPGIRVTMGAITRSSRVSRASWRCVRPSLSAAMVITTVSVILLVIRLIWVIIRVILVVITVTRVIVRVTRVITKIRISKD